MLEVERPLVWRCGVSAPAFTSQLSALRPECRGCPVQAPAQDRWPRGLQVVSYGLLLPDQGHGRDTGRPRGHMLPPSWTLWVQDADKWASLFGTNDIDQYHIIVVSWPGVNVVKRGAEKTGEKCCLTFCKFHSYYFPMILCVWQVVH